MTTLGVSVHRDWLQSRVINVNNKETKKSTKSVLPDVGLYLLRFPTAENEDLLYAGSNEELKSVVDSGHVHQRQQ